MMKLTVTTRGRVTFRKDVLDHLGIKPGEKIELDLLPDSRAILKAAQPRETIDDCIGSLAGKTKKPLTIGEIGEISAAGWSGKK